MQTAADATPLFTEWFGSRAVAAAAATRLVGLRCGYRTEVSYELRADGRRDWQLRVFDADAKPVKAES